LALKYAMKEIKKEDFVCANDCILFAEMIYLDIVKDSMYIDVNNVVNLREDRECLFKYEKQVESIKPPKGCSTF
jgi:hypothetical protein